MAGEDATPDTFFVHPHTAKFASTFYFYAFGNTPPSDLLQHIPQDAVRADILSLGCGDLRDLLYSILLHGRRGVSCGTVPGQLTFTLNDLEPAIQARNLMMLQLILDSRSLLEPGSPEVDTLVGQMEAANICGSPTYNAQAEAKIGEAVSKTKSTANSETGSIEGSEGGQTCNVPFAQRVGEIFNTMYNVFVGAKDLQTIQDVAGRLAAKAASSEDWTSTELGRLVHFADDRSQTRVRDILTLYADSGLQGKVSAASVRRQRSALIASRISESTTFIPRVMGLASLREDHSNVQAHSDTVHKYLIDGFLDPVPLLLADNKTSLKRPSREHVNPLLLVTERKGTVPSLHYEAFPLEAFHTEGASWKLSDNSIQDEHGTLAPRVLKRRALDNRNPKVGQSTASARSDVQDARLGTALEQLAQMIVGFLAATKIVSVESSASMASATPHLRIIIHVGDAINLCDSILASSPSEGLPAGVVGPGASSSGSPAFEAIAFQQGTLQPLRLRESTFMGSRAEFDVISTSNLADHLGVVDIVVASSPLLRRQPHAVLLTSLMAAVRTLRMNKDTKELYEKLSCMTSQASAILLGVVPLSSLSSVVGHADTSSLMFLMGWKLSSACSSLEDGCSSTLRLTWKCPSQGSTTTDSSSGSTCIRADITPHEFANLTLPVYKAMFAHVPTTAMIHSGVPEQTTPGYVQTAVLPKHYTPVSFARLVALAGRRLHLTPMHFHSALDAIIRDSDIVLAPNLAQGQVAVFHAMGLAPISPPPALNVPLDTRRVVLLVPASGLSLLRAFIEPELYLSLSSTHALSDNHFGNVHMAFVRVRRGECKDEDGRNDWRSLSSHLMVRDTREDDPDAELMVSTLVPTYVVSLAPAALTELKLRPRDTVEMFQAPEDVIRRLGGQLGKAFYGANLANSDRTAMLTPGGPPFLRKSSPSAPPLACPMNAMSTWCGGDTACSGAGWPDEPKALFVQRSVDGNSILDQSLELIRQLGPEGDSLLVGRVTLGMVNREAREELAKGTTPHVEPSRDPCSVRVILGKALVHVDRFPFPVTSNDVRVEYDESKGCAHFTVLPLQGLLEVPFALMAHNVEEEGPRTLLSTLCWPICVPLASLPRLDFNEEWAHDKVMGPMSFHNADVSLQKKASRSSTGGPHLGFRGMKESMLVIATSACATHKEDSPIWKHEWVCITEDERHNEPALWVWVNEILLDPSNQALVLDCCIMPVDSMDHEAALQLGAVVGGMSTKFMQDKWHSRKFELELIWHSGRTENGQACHEELELWTGLLPVAVERARQTYAHASDCIYSIPSDAIPVDARPAICSCGMGKDLPPAFMESMKSVKPMTGGATLTSLMYRAALSPLYAPPEMAAAKGSAKRSQAGSGVRCAKCIKGDSSMLCSRCRKVRYCSRGCQRQDWKNHRHNCTDKSGLAKP